jgi:pimeloyl-[acyl-carrier protein] methyl ester esterase
MKLVLLPGMDGTGLLFKPLLNELPDGIDAEVICYSTTEQQTYQELSEEVKSKLPTEPFVLLAESFSGRVAFQLSLDSSIPIKKLILVASFLSNPFPRLGIFIRMLPLSFILSLPIPKFIVRYFCFGKFCDDELLKIFEKSIRTVTAEVLAFRLRQILQLAKPENNSNIDCLIIAATDDRLIPKSTSSLMKCYYKNAKTLAINGPHFLAQTNVKQLVLNMDVLVDTNTQCFLQEI